MECANPRCRSEFEPGKPWARYCSRSCGDRVRHRRAYVRRKGRRPSRRYYRMFLSLIDAYEHTRTMKLAR